MAKRQRRKPQRQERRRFDLPRAVETGEPVIGYSGQKLYKGTHVIRAGESSPGTITGIGPEQCVVRWLESGAVQAEITAVLRRYDRA